MDRRAARTLAAPRVLAAFALAAVFTACATGKIDVTMAVEGSDHTCTPDRESIAAGRIELRFTNTSKQTNELYVKQGDKIRGEREDVAPGATRTLVVTLKPGDYTLVCKPGQSGDGISSAITVTAAP